MNLLDNVANSIHCLKQQCWGCCGKLWPCTYWKEITHKIIKTIFIRPDPTSWHTHQNLAARRGPHGLVEGHLKFRQRLKYSYCVSRHQILYSLLAAAQIISDLKRRSPKNIKFKGLITFACLFFLNIFESRCNSFNKAFI